MWYIHYRQKSVRLYISTVAFHVKILSMCILSILSETSYSTGLPLWFPYMLSVGDIPQPFAWPEGKDQTLFVVVTTPEAM